MSTATLMTTPLLEVTWPRVRPAQPDTLMLAAKAKVLQAVLS